LRQLPYHAKLRNLLARTYKDGTNNVATPSSRNGKNESDMGQEVLQFDAMLVTPESANTTASSPTEKDLLSSTKDL
jgi:hypothetical protein